MKKMLKENWRVEAYPVLSWKGEEDESVCGRDCEKLLAEIKRHCDVESVTVMCDSSDVCGFCGFAWETEESGEPLCCNKAVDEWKAKIKKPSHED